MSFVFDKTDIGLLINKKWRICTSINMVFYTTIFSPPSVFIFYGKQMKVDLIKSLTVCHDYTSSTPTILPSFHITLVVHTCYSQENVETLPKILSHLYDPLVVVLSLINNINLESFCSPYILNGHPQSVFSVCLYMNGGKLMSGKTSTTMISHFPTSTGVWTVYGTDSRVCTVFGVCTISLRWLSVFIHSYKKIKEPPPSDPTIPTISSTSFLFVFDAPTLFLCIDTLRLLTILNRINWVPMGTVMNLTSDLSRGIFSRTSRPNRHSGFSYLSHWRLNNQNRYFIHIFIKYGNRSFVSRTY